MHLHPCEVQRIAWKPDAVLFVMQCSRVKSLLLWGCCLSRRDVLTRSRITTWLPRRISVWSVEKQILTSGLTHLFALKLIYIEGLLRTCSACLISSTEPIKQTNLLDKWQFVLNFRRSFVLFKYKCLILWCHQITADVINMHLCLILKEKYCAAWVQTAFSHRDEGPQLPWHPAAVHQLPRCLQCTRQLPETAAGWRVFCPSGLRGGSSDLWGLWSTESTLGGSGSAHCRGRTPQTTARGAAGFNQEFPEFEWRRGGDGGSAAASGQFGN